MRNARWRLAASGMSVEVQPRLGAKVTSLRVGAGPEWLAPPARPLREAGNEPGTWADYDCSGWDECFPNIAADASAGLADHGEVWSTAWEVDSRGDALVTTYRGGDGRLLERGLRLGREDGVPTLIAAYRLTAPADAGLRDWAWAQHPLLAADPTLRIELPAPAPVRLEAGFADGCVESDLSWLAPGGVMPTTTSLANAPGRAAKVWFEHPRPAWVKIVRGEDDWLCWRVDLSTVPHLGLWVNLGGWHAGTERPLAHVAVEPAYGEHDSLPAAVSAGAGPALRPGESCTWRVALQAQHGISK